MMGMQGGKVQMKYTSVESVIPHPLVIRTCSMVMSVQIPDQNLFVRRMVKYP